MSDITGFKTRNLYVRNAEWSALKKQARKRGLSLAQLVREVLDRFLGLHSVAPRSAGPGFTQPTRHAKKHGETECGPQSRPTPECEPGSPDRDRREVFTMNF